MLVDAHCHIDFPEFDRDREKVLADCARENIILVNSIVEPANLIAMELAKKHSNLYCTLGLSPSDLDEAKYGQAVGLIRKHKKDIVAVGEVGLDHYWVKDAGGRRIMEERFRAFIELSLALKLPLVVHSRDAEDRTLELVEEYGVRALLHCFSGNAEQALKAAELGCLVSVPTSIAYSKARRELARRLPIESLVLESDAPFQAPKPKTRNSPLNLKASVDIVSLAKGLSSGEVEGATSENAIGFYGLKID